MSEPREEGGKEMMRKKYFSLDVIQRADDGREKENRLGTDKKAQQ